MKPVNVINADNLVVMANETKTGLPDGRWVAARPIGMDGLLWRLRCAWRVFTGKCDVLKWTDQ